MDLISEVTMKKKYPDGVHIISNDEYHSSEGLSRSGLWQFKKSPHHYWSEYLSGTREQTPPTPSMVIGELVHCMSLEPEQLVERYAVAPEINKRTKEGKAQWDEFEQSVVERVVITQQQYDVAQEMSINLRKNDTFNLLVDDALIEKSIYFTHESTGLQCKVRPDVWQSNIVADLKTTADASYRAFQLSAYKFGYFLQAGMIKEALRSVGENLEKFVIVCVENQKPYATALYILDDAAVEYGVNLFNTLMDKFKACHDKNEWPGYGFQTLCLTSYANYED